MVIGRLNRKGILRFLSDNGNRRNYRPSTDGIRDFTTSGWGTNLYGVVIIDEKGSH